MFRGKNLGRAAEFSRVRCMGKAVGFKSAAPRSVSLLHLIFGHGESVLAS